MKKKCSLLQLTLLAFFIFTMIGCFSIAGNSNEPIPRKDVWKVVKKQAKKHNLNPDFVYAIAFAESSFRPRADSGKALGMMQLTQPAWEMVTDKSYRRATDWKTNIEVGTAYLALNRDWLRKKKKFNYARLAVSYRHGYGALRDNNFKVTAFPKPKNKIYAVLFRGKAPKLSKS